MNGLARTLFLLSVALLPWAGLPFPSGLHPRAQWSDVAFAASALALLVHALRSGGPWRWRPLHVALAVYLLWAVVSLLLAPRPGPHAVAKVLGLGELAALLIVTSALSRGGAEGALARTIAWSALAVGVAAGLGVALAVLGMPTPLVGGFGDLRPGRYARAQAGLGHPNLLASWCVFASAVLARQRAALPPRLYAFAQGALSLSVLLTFSRTVLAFVCAVLLRGARTPRARSLAAAALLASAGLLIALTLLDVSIDPTRPWEASLRSGPSPRLQALRSAGVTLAAHPLTGSGPDSHPGQADGLPFDAHLTPLDLAATLGLPALLALVTVVALLWKGRQRPTEPAVWSGLAAMALDAMAQDIQDFRHLWILLGLADGSP